MNRKIMSFKTIYRSIIIDSEKDINIYRVFHNCCSGLSDGERSKGMRILMTMNNDFSGTVILLTLLMLPWYDTVKCLGIMSSAEKLKWNGYLTRLTLTHRISSSWGVPKEQQLSGKPSHDLCFEGSYH